MNEEEIMLEIEEIRRIDCSRFTNSELEAIQGLLNLYEKEKEKNKKYQGIENGTTIIYKAKAKYVREDRINKYYIKKEKIREKIKEYDEAIKILEDKVEKGKELEARNNPMSDIVNEIITENRAIENVISILKDLLEE